MYFIFSKLLIYFIYPLSWVSAGLILALLVRPKKLKKVLLCASILLIYVFSNSFLLNVFARNWDITANQISVNQKFSCGIVLGGYVSEDGNGQAHFNWAEDRFLQAIMLQESGRTAHLLFSGGNPDLRPDAFVEGNWIRRQLTAFHLPDSTLLFEKQSRNTIENIQNSKAILAASQLPPPYLLITSSFHMRRALLICEKQNLEVVPYPCNFFAGKNSVCLDDFVPDAAVLSYWNIYLKELVGYVVTELKQ